MQAILRFTLFMGALSSLFDIATFALLRLVFVLDVPAFRTAWFVESIASQILVIFIIRTALSPLKSHPHEILALTSLGALSCALVIALTPLGTLAQLVLLPSAVVTAMIAMVGAYLLCAEIVKRVGAKWLYPSKLIPSIISQQPSVRRL
jgi:Mg2+-importing ATPase